MQLLLRSAIVLVVLLSSNALFAIGVNYLGSGGSPLEKLHPAFYAAMLAVSMYVFTSTSRSVGNLRIIGLQVPTIVFLVAAVWITVWAVISPGAGGEISLPLVTWVMPSLLLLCMTKASDSTLRFLAVVVPVFLLLNSLIGIFSNVTGINFLPQIAGNVVIRDPRPTALLGHPLINSQMTGVMLLFLIQRGMRDGFTVRDIAAGAIHALALLAFGGRTALAISIGFAGIYVIFKAYGGAIKGNPRSMVVLFLLAVISVTAGFFAFEAGLGDVLLDRLADDRGSADTRLAAIEMLSRIGFDEWVMGIGPAARFAMAQQLNTPNGVESFPLALLISYGLPTTLFVIFAAFWPLYRLARPLKGIGWWSVTYFFVTSAASLSLGSKSTALALFMIVLVALTTRQKIGTMVNAKPTRSSTLAAARQVFGPAL